MTTDNLLQSIEFSFSMKRLAETNYFVQRATLPGLSLGETEQPNPYGGRIFLHGTKLNHDEFSLTFKVDENMNNWLEIYAWIVGINAPQKAEQYTQLKNSPDGVYSDATLIIHSSAKNPLHQFTFKNMHPKSLSGIELDATQVGQANYAAATATFQYDYFEYKRLSV